MFVCCLLVCTVVVHGKVGLTHWIKGTGRLGGGKGWAGTAQLCNQGPVSGEPVPVAVNFTGYFFCYFPPSGTVWLEEPGSE